MTTYTDPSSDEDTVLVLVDQLVSDQGTVVVFQGEINTARGDQTITFAVDHSEAAVIVALLADDSVLGGDPIEAYVPSWAILGRVGA